MNILFMCLGTFSDLNESSVHIDILKRFAREHNVWLVCKNEGKATALTDEQGIHILRVHTGELKNVGLIQKGINTVKVEPQFRNAIRKHLNDANFDLVLYTTPPITFASAVRYIRKRDKAVTYLMLKDIFPQNAVDIGMMATSGAQGILYRYFRNKEKQLYDLSDTIGCMSQANIDYIRKHNPYIPIRKLEICPNTTNVEDRSVDADTRIAIREKYQIPLDKTVFVYGGNLGKPQDIPFLIECLKAQKEDDAFFLIIGGGTEYERLKQFMDTDAPDNCRLMSSLPSKDFETLVAACDVGMIFLDHRFTIPNFPSRILSYMKAKVPVLAVTDPNTDVGEVIIKGNFGWWCESDEAEKFTSIVRKIVNEPDLRQKGMNAFQYLSDNYSVDVAYNTIMNRVNSEL